MSWSALVQRLCRAQEGRVPSVGTPTLVRGINTDIVMSFGEES